MCVDLNLCNPSKSVKTDVNISINGNLYRYEIKNITSIGDIRKSLSVAVPLLSNENYGNKTFHFKNNKLIFSRYKLSYCYTKEYNLNPIGNINFTLEKKLTLYELYKVIYEKWPTPTSYAYAKMIHSKILKDPSLYEELTSKNPKEYINKLKLKTNDTLESIIKDHVKSNNFSHKDFLEKNEYFRNFIKRLKTDLIEKKIEFNSLTINTVLNKIFFKDL